MIKFYLNRKTTLFTYHLLFQESINYAFAKQQLKKEKQGRKDETQRIG
ncbi:MAG: hypothetical protein U9532_03595 ['Conium maculatum' witches'-broom phytoplasma]|nr:hypothetical protein ['Conium maculatum' witches'-broom phytoplasma]